MSKPATRRKGNGEERGTTRGLAEKQTSTFTLERQAPAQEITSEEIEARAYAIFLARGRRHGDDQSDWFRAEAELRRERGLEKRDPSRND